MKRLLVMVSVVMCVAGALAMPTQAELDKAQPLVVELMAPVMAEFKAVSAKGRSEVAIKVADKSVEFANSAETEAAKFMLLKGAVSYYARGGAYDKASDALQTMMTEIKSVPPTVICEIVGKLKISEAKAPKLYAQFRVARLQMRAENEAAILVKKLKKEKSEGNQRRYAEVLAASGNWEAAFTEFAKLNDAKLKAIVEAESKGEAKNVESGEFWWAYKPTYKEADCIFKSRAVMFYRKALDAGEITGLKKTIVEQRIAGMAAEEAVPITAKGSANKNTRNISTPSGKAWQEKGNTAWLTFKNGQRIEFVKCPAGSFMMGRAGDNDPTSLTYFHKVNITRDFWFSKYKITRGQWEAVEKPVGDYYKSGADVSNVAARCMEYRDIERFVSTVNIKYCRLFGKKMVARLPSEAEWEYALTAGCDDSEDPYIKFRNGVHSEVSEVEKDIVIEFKTIKEEMLPLANDWIIKNRGEKGRLAYYVGRRKPNRWGIYDMLSNGGEYTLDLVWHPRKQDGKWDYRAYDPKQRGLSYQEEETDPLHYFVKDGERDEATIIRGSDDKDSGYHGSWYHRRAFPVFTGYGAFGFHLVIGPDLVSEWKAKHAKK